MKLPFISRRQHEQQVRAVAAAAQRAVEQADMVAACCDSDFKAAQERLAEADAANRRLFGRNLELGRRLATLTEADPEYTAQLERRLSRALRACARHMNTARAEQRRADQLQHRLDDATGFNSTAVTDGIHWQRTRADRRAS
ncbi:hypothetical protein ACGFZR_15460 [Streptomyces sp. NPDC048241]|uniref:hypothetical protein n=1 Tax=Streptomyces sp. NPDC048241 TaxID=3365521 RepID=UPI00371485A5